MVKKIRKRNFLRNFSGESLNSIFVSSKKNHKTKSINKSQLSKSPTSTVTDQITTVEEKKDKLYIPSNEFELKYAIDIYKTYCDLESLTAVRPIYMNFQTHIDESMRAILIDWLVDAHEKFHLLPETLYLTVNLIDRYLNGTKVKRNHLQLVGITCTFIASKYEEIDPPSLKNLVYICNGAYDKYQILNLEKDILKKLDFRITTSTSHSFLMIFLDVAKADKTTFLLSSYILDGSLLSYNLLHFDPSQLAAASLLIARRCTSNKAWSPVLCRFTSYSEVELLTVARAILVDKNHPTDLSAVNRKYSSNRYSCTTNLFKTSFQGKKL